MTQASWILCQTSTLEPITAALFGGDRLWGYDFPFPVTDRKLLAVEYGELGLAIEDGGSIEVDPTQGTRSVALSYAMLESSVAGRALSLEDVLCREGRCLPTGDRRGIRTGLEGSADPIIAIQATTMVGAACNVRNCTQCRE